MVRVWEHARLEISLPEGFERSLNVGSQYSLWDGYLLDWLENMRTNSPDIAIRAQFGFSDTLMQGLVDGLIDLGVMYTPQGRPGIEVEMLFEDELVLVSSEPNPSEMPDKNYVFIDWGPEFRADHALNFPEITIPGTYLDLGSLSLQYLLKTKSSGYVPRRHIKDYIKSGDLFEVSAAPIFSYPAYAVYASDEDPSLMKIIINELQATAASLVAK